MYRRYLKRAIDIIVAIAWLLVLWPFVLIVAILVWLKLGRPVLFSQRRIGYRGREFRIYKFRTMRDDRGPDGNLLPDAERTPKFGRLLRSTSMDELPGLINVLKGEMSFIGPRPWLAEYLPYYTDEEFRRHDAVPGMIGWGALFGRNAQTWEQIFEHDLYYVRHCSFLMDLKIFFNAFIIVFKRENVEQTREYLNVERAGRHYR